MRLKGFNLNQLVCLEALLSERNVTRAADRVHLSQSAMSASLAQLRHHFGDDLLVRSGRSLVLTPFARSLIAPLSDLMSRAQMFTSLGPEQTPQEVDRELTLVASDYTMTTILASAINRSGQAMPNLRFEVLPLTTASTTLLENGEIDLLLAGQALKTGQSPNVCVSEDEFVCLSCSRHKPRGKRLSRSEYGRRRHVVVRYFEHQMAFEDEEVLRKVGFRRQPHLTVWSYSLVPQLICGTPMISTVPRRIAEQLAERWPVSVSPFPFDQQPVRLFAYWHPSRDGDSVLRTFLDHLVETDRAA